MHAVGTGQLQHRAVLREQHHWRYRLAGQLSGQEIEHREGRLLHGVDGRTRDQRGFGGHALHRRFAGAQHIGHCWLAHQFQRTHALVQLRTCAAQHRGVDRIQIASPRGFGLFQKAAQRLVGRFQ